MARRRSGMDNNTKLFQVSLRTILEVTAVVAFILALAYQRLENKNGRYQLTVEGPTVYVTDTTTGQVWRMGSNGRERWNSLPLP
jgi:hypothetical protein